MEFSQAKKEYEWEKLKKAIPYLDKINEAAEENPVFLVGGSVRDFLLGRTSSDWDFVVEGDARDTARKFADIIEGAFVVLDEQFEIYRVVPNDKSLYYDFAICRENIEHDLSLRDFTMNAMAIHIKSGDIFDPWKGMEDLSLGCIRTLSKNCLTDDPVRMLRAYRMKSTFGYTIDEETHSWIRKLAAEIAHVAPERVRDELFKILRNDNAAGIFLELFHDGLLSVILPELLPMVGMEQNRFHRYDVFDHSFGALEEFEKLVKDAFGSFTPCKKNLFKYFSQPLAGERIRLELVKLAILLHDIGKPSVRRVENDILYYIGHHETGREMWLEIADRLRLSRKEKIEGAAIIEYHMEPVFIPQYRDEKKMKRAIYRFFKNTHITAPATVLLSWADVEAGRGEALTDEMIELHHQWAQKLVRKFFEQDILVNPPVFLDGRDIMIMLEITGSKKVGQVLEELQERAAIGEIQTYEQAIAFVQAIKNQSAD